MVNDKLDLLERLSTVILGHSSYNTIFESIKYENTVPDYNASFDFKWNSSEKDNVVSVTSASPVDCAKSIDRESSLQFDTGFFYYIENDTLSQISVQISNIKSNYSSKSILVNDFINNIVQYIVSGIYGILDGRDYISLSEDGQKARINFDKNMKASVEFKKENGASLSIRSIFINDLDVIYNITEKNDLLDEVRSFSDALAEDVSFILEHNNKEVADLYKRAWQSSPVSGEAISKSYKEIEIGNAKDYLFNVILHKIQRNNQASVADILTLCDGVNIELESVSYIVNF